MKKILTITAIIVIIAVTAIGIFVATFNINAYKGALISKLEEATGNKADIGRLSLQWKGKILLGIENFKIYREEDGQKINMLSFDRASAVVEPAPLLLHQVKLSSISVIHPNIHIIRKKDAGMKVRGYNEKPVKGKVSAKSAAGAAIPSGLNIGSVEIEDGTLRFQDMMSGPVSDITLKNIDAVIKNISIAGPIEFKAKMVIAGTDQNVTFSGMAGGFNTGSPFIRDFEINADLAAFDHAELLKAFPALQKIGFGPGPAGLFRANVRELALADNKISKISADVSFTDGRIGLTGLKAPIESINLSAAAEGSSITIKSFSAQLANGSVKGTGRIDDIFASPRAALQATVEVRGVKSFISSVFAQNQNMDGNANLTFDGTMTGTTWPEISRTLAGGGEFSLDSGVMVNTNVLNQTLGALTLFPGLPDMVRGYVPAGIQQSFGANNTIIKPMRQPYTIESGYVMLANLNLETDTFDMRGNAKSSLTGDISGSGMIRFAQSVSTAMIRAVPEMKYVTDDQGMVEFPMAFKAGGGDFKIIPDLKYVGQKVAVHKAGEVVAGYIQNVTKNGGASPSAQGAASGSGKMPKLKDIMKSLMEQQK